MSLATRCNSCGTIFRVVQDQLKVSEGWVRCGRCDAVFNATEGLFELEREAPPAWIAPAAPTPASDPGARSAEVAPRPAAPEEELSFRQEDDRFTDATAPGNAAVAPHAVGAPPRDGPDAVVTASALLRQPSASAPEPVAALPVPAESPPRFVERAHRDAFWRSRRSQTVLGIAALLLLSTLALQAAQQFSELAAARWPNAQPALARWCGWTGCSLAAPHRIDDIAVESSALAAIPASNALRLSIALRNRADFAVALPSVDLSLTDNAGQLVARRALHPRDFAASAPAVGAGAETTLQTVLDVGVGRVSGYTVEIFYP